jgi:hypothetical protein
MHGKEVLPFFSLPIKTSVGLASFSLTVESDVAFSPGATTKTLLKSSSSKSVLVESNTVSVVTSL